MHLPTVRGFTPVARRLGKGALEGWVLPSPLYQACGTLEHRNAGQASEWLEDPASKSERLDVLREELRQRLATHQPSLEAFQPSFRARLRAVGFKTRLSGFRELVANILSLNEQVATLLECPDDIHDFGWFRFVLV